ncbi:MAG: DNA ligase-associated DEXH box helicase [Bacteroidia bacterium]|nr:MAG: DNA ligase-associated DEXH box helicase [Bacteroidia bacterium]
MFLSGEWLRPAPEGIYCEPGDFYIDPWRPVPRALITHAHSDHARAGCGAYLTSAENAPLLRHRVGSASIEALPWGKPLRIGPVEVSFHPAGHIRGSAQIRLAYRGEVWVITGDYKRQADPTTALFEPLRADVIVSECTFGLPIYRWPPAEGVIQELLAWWQACAAEGKNAVLYVYALGKAQRVLASLPSDAGPLYVHASIAAINALYEAEGVKLASWRPATEWVKGTAGALILAPPQVQGSRWVERFAPYEEGQASGWMAIRGRRRQRALDRGFVLSDHADFPALEETIRESGAQRVFLTHGYRAEMAQYLRTRGWEAYLWETAYAGEVDSEPDGSLGGPVADASSGELPPEAPA